jgi:hypothetical protein
MKRIAVLVLALTAACGGAAPATSLRPEAVPTQVPAPTAVPVPTPLKATVSPKPVPSFSTPEAAMVYLASAWNRGDLAELKHVTDPVARDLLWNMHREATNLRLKDCTYDKQMRDYSCLFTHDYPVGYQGAKGKVGNAVFRVGPVRRSGWYMTVYESCG